MEKCRRSSDGLYISLIERASRLEEKVAANEKAVITALAALDKRLEGINEQRGQLKDQASTFPTRNEMNNLAENNKNELRALSEKLSDAVARIDKQQGTGTGIGLSWVWLIGAIGIISTILSLMSIIRK